jgi:hypothetical protein
MQVQIVACTSDERLKVIIYSNFGQLMGDVDSAITLYVRGAIQGSVRITVDESRTPLANWPFPSDLSEGIGAIYEGSFDNSASMDGGAATVSGSFSVCHVANLPSGR